jgi:hypothetical protein
MRREWLCACGSQASARVLYLRHVFPGQYGFRLYNEEYVRIFCEAGQTPDLRRALGHFLVQVFTSKQARTSGTLHRGEKLQLVEMVKLTVILA